MMKSFSKLMFAALLATGFWACSDEVDVPDNGGTETTDKVYMSFKLDLPSAPNSRSATDQNAGQTNSNESPDYEIGNSDENTVTSMYVVLVKADNGDFVASSYVTSFSQSAGDNSTTDNIYTLPFEAEGLNDNLASTSVKVLVFCNPIAALKTELDKKLSLTNFQDLSYSLTSATDATAWTNEKFPMSNAEITPVTLPSSFADYRDPSKPYYLGTVKVERSVARFDYAAKYTNNVYSLQKNGDDDAVTVQLNEVALLNLSKSFYYLRRVAASTDATNTVASSTTDLCGQETPTNWVIDTDATAKSSYSDGSAWNNNFYYSMTSSESNYNHVEQLAWTSLSTIANATVDQWGSTSNTNDYRIWRYATENTIPSTAKQVQALTTHVVFKGELTVTDKAATNVKDAFDKGEQLFVFEDKLYGAWDDVVTAATKTGTTDLDLDTRLGQAVSQAKSQMTSGETTPSAAALAAAGFKGYTATTTSDNKIKYEVLYYYKNRHNNNNDNAEMGIMEYAVVRNNVYKLMVESISKFGHPTNPTDPDPDPEDPDDPDEEDVVYFTVSVKVLPWVVRVNNIEF